jgi:hypothetical protein
MAATDKKSKRYEFQEALAPATHVALHLCKFATVLHESSFAALFIYGVARSTSSVGHGSHTLCETLNFDRTYFSWHRRHRRREVFA